MRAPDVLSLIDYFIFNILVCNPDTHANNYSLMISGNGVSLAPIYGVTCVAAWDGISHKLDQMLAARAHRLALSGRPLRRTAASIQRGCSPAWRHWHARFSRETREAAAAVAAMPAGPHPLMPRLVEAIETRARRHRSIAERYGAQGKRCMPRGGASLPTAGSRGQQDKEERRQQT